MVALQHNDLKEMGIASVGHRLTILKSVYDIKIKQDVPIESDHYVPLCKLVGLYAPSVPTDLPYSSRCRGPICHCDTERHQKPCRAIEITRRTNEYRGDGITKADGRIHSIAGGSSTCVSDGQGRTTITISPSWNQQPNLLFL